MLLLLYMFVLEGVSKLNWVLFTDNPCRRVQDGYTALILAARGNHLEVTELLLKCGANKALQATVVQGDK